MGILQPALSRSGDALWRRANASHSVSPPVAAKIAIVIDPDGRLFLEGEAIRLWALDDRLAAASAAHPGASVIITGDRLVPWRDRRNDRSAILIEVLDLCGVLGLMVAVTNSRDAIAAEG